MPFILKALAFLIPFISALSFSVQPIIGKYLLPSQGGNISSWLIIMLFFQMALLIGYSVSFLILKLQPKFQYITVCILALLSIFCINLTPTLHTTLAQYSLFILLISNLLIPISFLFGYSILIQGWFTYHNRSIPYYLYGISNLGSLLGLISYPFIIEPYTNLLSQINVWYYIFISLLSVIAVSSLYLLTNPGIKKIQEKVPITTKQFLSWTFISIVPCLTFLEITRILSLEWGSNPLTWIAPLGLYLFVFFLAFSSKKWEPSKLNSYFYALIIGTILFSLSHSIIQTTLGLFSLIALACIILGGLCGGLRLLYSLRPLGENFSLYYTAIGLGGVVAGIIANIIGPIIFIRPVELIFVNLILIFIWFKHFPVKLPVRTPIYIVSIVFSIMITKFVYEKIFYPDREYFRSNFSTYMVENSVVNEHKMRLLKSGFTVHGVQSLEKPMLPTTYYWERSASGLWLQFLQHHYNNYNVAVIGLGAGALSVYNSPDDILTYFEIDPLVEYIANTQFTFLKDSKGFSSIYTEDGRIGVRDYHTQFTSVIVDAFSGDGIPLYLLTKEAIKEYVDQSSTGVVLLHISNQYWDLRSVIHGSAYQNSYSYFIFDTLLRDDSNIYLETNSRYAFIYKPSSEPIIQNFLQFINTLESRGENRVYQVEDKVLWNDFRYSVLDVPKFK